MNSFWARFRFLIFFIQASWLVAKKSGCYIYTELRPWAFVLSSGSSLHYIVTFYLFNYLLTGVNVFIVWTLSNSTKKFSKVFGDFNETRSLTEISFSRRTCFVPCQSRTSLFSFSYKFSDRRSMRSGNGKGQIEFPVRPGPTEKSFPIGRKSIVLCGCYAAKCNTNAKTNNIDAECNWIFNAKCNNYSKA